MVHNGHSRADGEVLHKINKAFETLFLKAKNKRQKAKEEESRIYKYKKYDIKKKL